MQKFKKQLRTLEEATRSDGSIKNHYVLLLFRTAYAVRADRLLSPARATERLVEIRELLRRFAPPYLYLPTWLGQCAWSKVGGGFLLASGNRPHSDHHEAQAAADVSTASLTEVVTKLRALGA